MTTLADPVRATEDAPLPSAWRLGLGRGRIEVTEFFREKMAVCFTSRGRAGAGRPG